MNWAVFISAVIAFVAPYLSRKGIIVPPELAGWVTGIFTFITGLIHNGVSDLKTTTVGAIGGAIAGASAAFGADPATQASLQGVVLWAIGLLTNTRPQVTDAKGNGNA